MRLLLTACILVSLSRSRAGWLSGIITSPPPPPPLYRDGYRVHLSALPTSERDTLIPGGVLWSDIAIVETLSVRPSYTLLKCVWRRQSVIVKKFIGDGKDIGIHVELGILRRTKHANVISLLGWGVKPSFVIYEDIETTVSQLQNVTAIATKAMCGESHMTREKQKFMMAKVRAMVALPQEQALSIARQVADGLIYLHENFHPGVRIILNSLSPESIGITKDGTVKLLDFADCVLIRRSVFEDVVFRLPIYGYNYKYRSPEQIKGDMYNQKSDVFSFAVVLFQIVSGKHPARISGSYSRYMTAMVHYNERPEMDVKWGVALTQLLANCWNAEVIVRPNMVDVRISLERMRSGSGLFFSHNETMGSRMWA